MNMGSDSRIDFPDFISGIKERLTSRPKRELAHRNFRKASVMVIFLERRGMPHVLLTRRTDMVSTHKGQISFPGGSVDPSDRGNLEAGLRETFEEVGIEAKDIEVLGEFDEYFSIAGFHVYVFAAVLWHSVVYSPSGNEIEKILEVPFTLFMEEKYYRCETLCYDGDDYDVYYYNYEGDIIWGMTARILTDFSRKICNK